MIITKTVFVHVAAQRTYYENKGYDLSSYMHKNDKGKMVVSQECLLEVKVEDLPARSSRKVLAKCDNPECGKERWVEYDKYTSLCHKCAMQTESYKKNNGNAQKGKKRTSLQRERMKKPHYGGRGYKSGRWDSSITDEERITTQEKSRNSTDYKAWRLFIFRKYAYQCQNCGYHGKRINAHHLESYFVCKELRTDKDNGIVLCVECHRLFHKTYGKTGTHKWQMEEFLSNNILMRIFDKREYSLNKPTRQGCKDANSKFDSSIYVGVTRGKNGKKWSAGIYSNKQKYCLGTFETEIEAGMAYNEAALELHGWKASINNISQEEIMSLWEE